MQFNEDGQGASAMSGNAMSGNAELALQVQMLKTRLDVVLPTLATREQLQQEVGAIRGSSSTRSASCVPRCVPRSVACDRTCIRPSPTC